MKQNGQFRASLGYVMSFFFFSQKKERQSGEGEERELEEKMEKGRERRGGTGSPSFIRSSESELREYMPVELMNTTPRGQDQIVMLIFQNTMQAL